MSTLNPGIVTCLYCNRAADQPIGSEPDKRKSGKCPECKGPHHVYCWHAHGGCSRPNCVCNPKTARHGQIPFQPAQVHDVYSPSQSPEQAHAQPDRWTAFEKFESEYATGSHRRIVMAWDDALFRHFQPADKYRDQVVEAKKCVRALEQLVTEYRRKNWQNVVEIYNSNKDHFDSCSDFQTNFKQHVEEARKQVSDQYKQRLVTALDQNDDQALEDILADKSLGYRPTAMLQVLEQMNVLTEADRARAALALERLAVIRQVKTYLARKDGQEAALAMYDSKVDELHLADSKALTKADRTALYEARRAHTRDSLRQAVMRGDDKELMVAASAALAAGWAMPDNTLELVRQAGERQAARERMAQAGDETARLIAVDDAMLLDEKLVDPTTREEIETTRRIYKPLLALKRALKRNDVRTAAALAADPEQARDLASQLDETEKAEFSKVQSALATGNDVRAALAVTPPTADVFQQIADLCHNSDTRRMLKQILSPFENQQLDKALVTAEVMDELRRFDQAPDIPHVKLAVAKSYNKAREAGIVLPGDLNWSKIRGAVEFQERWAELNRAIESGDEYAIFNAWNPNYMYDALDMLNERDKQTLVRALQNRARTERLQSALASDDAERVAFAGRELSNTQNLSN
jgi:hypothetical protein